MGHAAAAVPLRGRHAKRLELIAISKTISDANVVIASVLETFRSQKTLAQRAIAQVSDEQLHQPLDPHTNSIAVIMQHLAGNMLSRWTDFLSTDGEKAWRDRDGEFVDQRSSRQQLEDQWEQGWACAMKSVSQLSDQALGKIVHIRGQPHTVIRALDRQIDHVGYHVGQIVQIARILAGDHWTTLSIPRGESEAYNRRVWPEGPQRDDSLKR